MGGVSNASDVRQFYAAGANLIGIGSALTGMDSAGMREYFGSLETALRSDPAAPHELHLPGLSMEYSPAKILRHEEYYPGLFKIVLDRLPIQGQVGELAGRYFFLYVPGVGEKPFAVFSAEEKSIVVKTVGRFTRQLSQLPVGSTVYLRGPYGKPFPNLDGRTVVMVGGGTGIASLFEIAKLLETRNRLLFFLGGRSAGDLFEMERFQAMGSVECATNDGSAGHRGFIPELLTAWLSAEGLGKKPVYVLCGPEPMVEACFKLLRPVADPEDLWAAIEYTTSCGVGICGKCASPSGALTCIDGPFMTVSGFSPSASGARDVPTRSSPG
jgi:dihydroorotate dehydrogenase (NAD+) catalytic subunit